MRIKVNSNKEIVKEIREKLRDNDGYCPCRISRTPETKCMCKEFRDMMERNESGECHCGLYVLEQEE